MINITENYIAMLRNSKIQELWKPEIGDFCIDMGDLWLIHDEDKRKYVEWAKEKDTWIPRLDQLIDILIIKTNVQIYSKNWFDVIDRIVNFNSNPSGFAMMAYPELNEKSIKNKICFDTIEENVLACIMYFAYDEYWVDGKWITRDELIEILK